MTQAYDSIGRGYSGYRQADSRIQAEILSALGDVKSVINVGAGTGSYEPSDRSVTAIEPAMTMIRQRGRDTAPVAQATAEQLPFADKSFDAALAILTIHHWNDWRSGVREMLRVATQRIVILTYDPDSTSVFWLVNEYFPEIAAIDRAAFPPIGDLSKELGNTGIRALPVPHDCTDGVLGAYWRRPHAYLDTNVRRAISTFAKITNEAEGLEKLQRDLQSGKWELRHSDLRSRNTFDLGYRLIVATP
jgi:SAM-dependent methyltransferase